MTEADYLKNYRLSNYIQTSIATDIACFSVSELKENNYRKLSHKKLSILLIKRGEHPYKGKWALPGGFLQVTETLEKAAIRELREETGIEKAYMEQLYSFSSLDRDPRARIISVAYLALLNKRTLLRATTDATEAKWFEVSYKKLSKHTKKLILRSEVEEVEAKDMAFDHADIIILALERLRGKVEYTPIALNLLPKQFTLSSLQQVYEAILDRPLIAANFRRKMKGLVIETENYAENGGHRPSKLYKRREDEDE